MRLVEVPIAFAGGSTRPCERSTAFLLLEIKRLSNDDPTRGSLHGFPWDDVAFRLNPSPNDYRSAHRFLRDPIPPRVSVRLTARLPGE